MRATRLCCPGRAIGRFALFLFFALGLLTAAAIAGGGHAHAAPTLAGPVLQVADPGQQIFQTRCTGCHTIGKGKLVGPDLAGVTQRRDQAWLHNFILDPTKMIASGDPIAKQLLAENNNVQMPTLGLTPADADALIAYLGSPAGGAGGQPAPAAAAPGPAAPVGYVDVGQRLFTGQQRLTNAGTPCLTCHSVSGAAPGAALGGGALGPDLTHVAQRYNGATGLVPVLTTIAFPTMMGPFTGHALTPAEVGDVVAFLQQQDQSQPPVAQIAPGTLSPDFWRVLVIGLVGGVILTLALFVFWPRQRLSISERLRSTARNPLRDRNA